MNFSARNMSNYSSGSERLLLLPVRQKGGAQTVPRNRPVNSKMKAPPSTKNKAHSQIYDTIIGSNHSEISSSARKRKAEQDVNGYNDSGILSNNVSMESHASEGSARMSNRKNESDHAFSSSCCEITSEYNSEITVNKETPSSATPISRGAFSSGVVDGSSEGANFSDASTSNRDPTSLIKRRNFDDIDRSSIDQRRPLNLNTTQFSSSTISDGEQTPNPLLLNHNGVNLKPEFMLWKPFRCPVFGCRKGYTHQRRCKNHPHEICVMASPPEKPVPISADNTKSKRAVNGYAQRYIMQQQEKYLKQDSINIDPLPEQSQLEINSSPAKSNSETRKQHMQNTNSTEKRLVEHQSLLNKIDKSIYSNKSSKDEVPSDFLVEAHWVSCSKCEKWRKIPMNLNLKKIGVEWFCSDQLWIADPLKRSCNAPEEKYDAESTIEMFGVSSASASKTCAVKWPCHACTFLNQPKRKTCAVCQTKRFPTRGTIDNGDGIKFHLAKDGFVAQHPVVVAKEAKESVAKIDDIEIAEYADESRWISDAVENS